MKKIIFLISLLGLIISGPNVFASSSQVSEEAIMPTIDFTLNTLDGQAIKLSSLKGKKVLLNFFATWCPPCRVELKDFDEINRKYQNQNFKILCVSVDNKAGTVRSFMTKNRYSMTVLFDDKNVANSYNVRGIPTTFLLNENGDIVWHHVGLASKKDIMSILGIGE